MDPYCCDVQWDGICAAEAADICVDGGICLVTGPFEPTSVAGGRAYIPEPVSKYPDYTPEPEK